MKKLISIILVSVLSIGLMQPCYAGNSEVEVSEDEIVFVRNFYFLNEKRKKGLLSFMLKRREKNLDKTKFLNEDELI